MVTAVNICNNKNSSSSSSASLKNRSFIFYLLFCCVETKICICRSVVGAKMWIYFFVVLSLNTAFVTPTRGYEPQNDMSTFYKGKGEEEV